MLWSVPSSHVVQLATLPMGGLMSMIASALVLCLNEHRWLENRSRWDHQIFVGASKMCPFGKWITFSRSELCFSLPVCVMLQRLSIRFHLIYRTQALRLIGLICAWRLCRSALALVRIQFPQHFSSLLSNHKDELGFLRTGSKCNLKHVL